jgi:hypothetical protein
VLETNTLDALIRIKKGKRGSKYKGRILGRVLDKLKYNFYFLER